MGATSLYIYMFQRCYKALITFGKFDDKASNEFEKFEKLTDATQEHVSCFQVDKIALIDCCQTLGFIYYLI